jgi:predicted dehydrogenase
MTQSSPAKLRVGIFGIGRRGTLQAALSQMHTGAEVAAICDPDGELIDFMRNFLPDCFFTGDADEMIEKSRLDAVFICTPHDSHLPLARKAIDNNIHVFVERPLAESLASGKKMMEVAQNRNLTYGVGYTLPFCPVFIEAKKLLDNHPLENIKRVRASLYHSLLTRPREGWMFEKEKSGGGILMHEASSLLLLLNRFFGPVRTVYAKSTQKFGEVEDSAAIVLEFQSGTLGHIDVSWSRPGYPLPATIITVEGTQGVMEINDDTLKLFTYRATKGFEKGWTILHRADLPASPRFYLGQEGSSEANGNFIDSCLKKSKPLVRWQEGLEVMRLVEAIYISVRTRQTIRLDEV